MSLAYVTVCGPDRDWICRYLYLLNHACKYHIAHEIHTAVAWTRRNSPTAHAQHEIVEPPTSPLRWPIRYNIIGVSNDRHEARIPSIRQMLVLRSPIAASVESNMMLQYGLLLDF